MLTFAPTRDTPRKHGKHALTRVRKLSEKGLWKQLELVKKKTSDTPKNIPFTSQKQPEMVQ